MSNPAPTAAAGAAAAAQPAAAAQGDTIARLHHISSLFPQRRWAHANDAVAYLICTLLGRGFADIAANVLTRARRMICMAPDLARHLVSPAFHAFAAQHARASGDPDVRRMYDDVAMRLFIDAAAPDFSGPPRDPVASALLRMVVHELTQRVLAASAQDRMTAELTRKGVPIPARIDGVVSTIKLERDTFALIFEGQDGTQRMKLPVHREWDRLMELFGLKQAAAGSGGSAAAAASSAGSGGSAAAAAASSAGSGGSAAAYTDDDAQLTAAATALVPRFWQRVIQYWESVHHAPLARGMRREINRAARLAQEPYNVDLSAPSYHPPDNERRILATDGLLLLMRIHKSQPRISAARARFFAECELWTRPLDEPALQRKRSTAPYEDVDRERRQIATGLPKEFIRSLTLVASTRARRDYTGEPDLSTHRRPVLVAPRSEVRFAQALWTMIARPRGIPEEKEDHGPPALIPAHLADRWALLQTHAQAINAGLMELAEWKYQHSVRNGALTLGFADALRFAYCIGEYSGNDKPASTPYYIGVGKQLLIMIGAPVGTHLGRSAGTDHIHSAVPYYLCRIFHREVYFQTRQVLAKDIQELARPYMDALPAPEADVQAEAEALRALERRYRAEAEALRALEHPHRAAASAAAAPADDEDGDEDDGIVYTGEGTLVPGSDHFVPIEGESTEDDDGFEGDAVEGDAAEGDAVEGDAVDEDDLEDLDDIQDDGMDEEEDPADLVDPQEDAME